MIDLLGLRKGEGFTLEKARDADVFLEMMGGAGQTFDELYTRFLSAIYSVKDEASVEVLLVAYGLEPGYEDMPSLKDRREIYGEFIGRKYDTIAKREKAAIQEMAVRILLSQWVNAPLPANIPVIHGGFICESLQSSILIRDRKLVETRETQCLIALADNLASFDYDTNELSVVEALQGCTVKTREISGGRKYILAFPKKLKRGQRHEVSFLEHAPECGKDGRTAIAVEVARSFAIPTFDYCLELIFVGQKPKRIWSYSMLTLLERPGDPEVQPPLDFLNGGSTVQVVFSHLHGGMFSGIAWEW